MRYRFGLDNPDITYVPHNYVEHKADLGEVVMNYAEAGRKDHPALLLIPSQTESWWGYENVMKELERDYNVYAVDLRGQGRSTRTPGRYTLDNMGNDLVRFIQLVIGRPAIISGLSSGGLLSTWLAAYAPPGLVVAACIEDAPLFAAQIDPPYGQGIRQGAVGPLIDIFSKFLGNQWSIGDWEGAVAAGRVALPEWIARFAPLADEPPQNIKEYDPEWGRAFWSGTANMGCDHRTMLQHVKVPTLFTHHFRMVVPDTGILVGAISDIQADQVRKLIEGAGQQCVYLSFPEMGHSMHGENPSLFVATLTKWIKSLAENPVR